MADGYIGAMLRPVTGGPMDPYRGPIFYDIPNIPGAGPDDTLEDYIPPASLILLECGPYRLSIGFYQDPCKPVGGHLDYGGSIEGGYNTPLLMRAVSDFGGPSGPGGSNYPIDPDNPGDPGDPHGPDDPTDPDDPADPDDPDDPVDPDDPIDPGGPDDPDDPSDLAESPEPSTVLLMGAGLAALVFARRKRR